MTKPLKPSQLPKAIPLPGKAAKSTVAREMGLNSGYFKKKHEVKGSAKEHHIHEQPPKEKEEIYYSCSSSQPHHH